ncbi:MAG: glycosyltransferase [Jannaschia sp.]
MKATPRVSVIIPCHNREDTIVDAVQSVLDQDFSDIEVICINDVSTDRTIAVLANIKDPRLRWADNTGPRGPSAARNCGVALSDADWIAFQDSDDIWLPGKLSAQMARLEGSDFVAAYCGMLIKEDAHPDTPVQGRIPDPAITPLEGDILSSLTRQSFISTQMLVVRRDVFDTVGGFDEDLLALVDWDLMLRVAGQGPVAFVDDDLVVQRMSSNSITNSSRKRLDAQEYILEKHTALLARYPSVMAGHHHRLAGGYRLFSDWYPAARHAALARHAAPGNMRYWVYAAYLRCRALF